MKTKIYEYLDKSIEHTKMLKVYTDDLVNVAFILQNSSTIYIAGNGGSAATASHMVNDLQKVCGLNAICLTDNVPVLTAYANDDCYENVFVNQIKDKATNEDAIVILSGSGDSENLLRLAKYGIDNGVAVVAFLGTDGGKMQWLNDVKNQDMLDGTYFQIHINSDQEHTEDWHLMLEHLLCGLIVGDKDG